MDRRLLENETRMLQGSINRMCVTNEYAELENWREWSVTHIEEIYRLNKMRLDERNNNERHR